MTGNGYDGWRKNYHFSKRFRWFHGKISEEPNCQNQNVNKQKILFLKCLKMNFINQLYMNSDRDGVIDKKNSFATFSFSSRHSLQESSLTVTAAALSSFRGGIVLWKWRAESERATIQVSELREQHNKQSNSVWRASTVRLLLREILVATRTVVGDVVVVVVFIRMRE